MTKKRNTTHTLQGTGNVSFFTLCLLLQIQRCLSTTLSNRIDHQ